MIDTKEKIIGNRYIQTGGAVNMFNGKNVPFDIEEQMHNLEKRLKNLNKIGSNSQGLYCHAGCVKNARTLQIYSTRSGKIVNYAQGFNFENGLINLFADIASGGKSRQSRRYFPGIKENAASSSIDRWLTLDPSTEMKVQYIDNGYSIEARSDLSDREYMHVASKRLVYAFEWFNQEVAKLNPLFENDLLKGVFANSQTERNTANYLTSDDGKIAYVTYCMGNPSLDTLHHNNHDGILTLNS